MKIISLCIVFLLLVSCGALVEIDYDKNIEFSEYTTYNFFPEISSGLSDLDNEHIIKITDSLLEARGFEKSYNPDILINFFAKERLKASNSSIGIGVAGGGGNVGVGVSGGIPIGGNSINQFLTIDFIDNNRDELIWQAVINGDFKEVISARMLYRYYEKALQKAYSQYPPNKE